jgi:hypothetical protein
VAPKLIVDLETCALENAADYVPAPDLTACQAPSTWKDPAKIAVELVRQRAELLEAYEAKLSKAALDWNLNRIVAIGYFREGDTAPQVLIAKNDAEERRALETFWHLAERRKLVGFCIRNFDAPTLVQRSRYLNVPHPTISLARWGRGDCLDLRDQLTFDDSRYEAVMSRSLTMFCKRFGLDVPEDPLTGADMAAAVQAGNWEAVTAHVLADVQKTAALAARLGHFTFRHAAVA